MRRAEPRTINDTKEEYTCWYWGYEAGLQEEVIHRSKLERVHDNLLLQFWQYFALTIIGSKYTITNPDHNGRVIQLWNRDRKRKLLLTNILNILCYEYGGSCIPQLQADDQIEIESSDDDDYDEEDEYDRE